MPGLDEFLRNMFGGGQPQPQAAPPMNAMPPQAGGMAQPPGMFGQLQQWNEANPGVLASIGAGMMQGNMGAGLEQAGKFRAIAQRDQKQQAEETRTKNMTRQWLLKQGLSDVDADAAMANPAIMSQIFKPAEKPSYMSLGDGYALNESDGSIISAPGAGPKDDFTMRKQQAAELGISQDDPRYQPFVATGKFPREDQQALTVTDKKAILEADEMVAANQNAIKALEKAESLSSRANSGWLAGARATAGNNLPDWMVPDRLSSPESSLATSDLDNTVIGNALASLKATFGGNPTEGERSILLELQGSSSMTKAARENVFRRAKELARARLKFNKKRADELRGGEFYKPGGGSSTGGIAPATGGNKTSSGVSWSIER